MIAFASLAFMMIYAVVVGTLSLAVGSLDRRAAMRHAIVATVGAAVVASFRQDGVFLAASIEMLASSAGVGGGTIASLFVFVLFAYYAYLCIIVAFFDRMYEFSFKGFFFFCLVFIISAGYCLSHLDIYVGGNQLIFYWMVIVGTFYFVFLGAMHVVFSWVFLTIDLIGVAASIGNKGELFYNDYFFILDLVPFSHGGMEEFVILLSLVLAAYGFGVDRGWFSALPIGDR